MYIRMAMQLHMYITTDNKFNMAITSFGGIIACNRDVYSLTIDL